MTDVVTRALLARPAPPARAWDDLRPGALKLIFLIVTRVVSLLGLSRREEWWKDAEILMLRHQLAVAQRERPRAHSRLTWLDRAWLALLAGTVPAERLAAMRLIVTPGDLAMAPGHRPSPRGAIAAPGPLRAPGDASQGAVGGAAAGAGSPGATAGSTASSRDSASRWHRQGIGGSSRTLASARRRAVMGRAGRSSCGPRSRGSWRWTSSPRCRWRWAGGAQCTPGVRLCTPAVRRGNTAVATAGGPGKSAGVSRSVAGPGAARAPGRSWPGRAGDERGWRRGQCPDSQGAPAGG